MNAPLTILAPTRYPWRFNSPRFSRHKIERRNFIPFNKVSMVYEGITILNPWPLRRFDLVHAFNRIPLGPSPFVIGFESHLPRAFGHEDSSLFQYCAKNLASAKCRRIIAISHYACGQFIHQHETSPYRDALMAKLEMRYPNIQMPTGGDAFVDDGMINLLFVGSHFARKGGCVALRIAELANQRNLPIAIEIVSSLQMGAESWVGPTRKEFFDIERRLLQTLPNVIHHGSLPNDQTVERMKTAHFLLLPTFSDTFGFSAIEAMANHTPVIATTQGALPEFIIDGKNGILLDLEKTDSGEWAHIGRTDRDTKTYETFFRDEVNRLAETALEKIVALARTPAYAVMRANVRATAEEFFCAKAANEYWDTLYDAVLS